MISFACPVCSTSYSVPDEQAGKKAKCHKCGERMVVPMPAPIVPPSDTSVSSLASMPAAPTPTKDSRPAAEPAPRAPTRTPTPADMPKWFEATLNAGDVVEQIGTWVFALAALACLVGAVLAFDKNQTAVAVGFVAAGALSLFNIAAVRMVVGATRVLVDIAQSLRILRAASAQT